MTYITPQHPLSSAYQRSPLSANLESARQLAFTITSTFEGGKVSSLQTKDAGVISYGKHQATLASGTLYKVIVKYCDLSKSKDATALKYFLPSLRSADRALRNDETFLSLLSAAAADPLMELAQDLVFTNEYWNPALIKASKLGIRSANGLAIFYDTNVHGGLDLIIERTTRSLKGRPVSEQVFLQIFLSKRREYLLSLSHTRKLQGDNINAAMLKNAAEVRIKKLLSLLN